MEDLDGMISECWTFLVCKNTNYLGWEMRDLHE